MLTPGMSGQLGEVTLAHAGDYRLELREDTYPEGSGAG